MDIFFEVTRAVIVGAVFSFLLIYRKPREIHLEGWHFMIIGFALIFFGTLIDISDNFTFLDQYILIGDTIMEAFLEKVVGYLLGFLFLALGIWRWVPGIIDHTIKARTERDQAMQQVKTLSGLLPICSSCKKIRDDKGYWNQIETYLHAHSDANFTHGICPDCKQKLYGEYLQSSENGKQD